MGKLNALFVKNAKPGRHSDGQGLILDVKPSGAAAWVLRIQANGKRHDIGLGSRNLVGLAEARESAAETRRQVRRGIDPSAAKRALRALNSAMPTFREAATDVHAERKGDWRNAKHRDQWFSSLERYAFPAIGDLKINAVEASQIRDLLQPVWLTKPETARRVLQRIGTVLDWAHAKGYRPHEAPTRSITRGLKKQPRKDQHFQSVPFAEIPGLMRNLAARESVGRLALQFLILTAARSGEVRGAKWEEIDLKEKLWTVPGERMKAGRPHRVPLNPGALALLLEAAKLRTGRPNELVFPGLKRARMSDMTLSKALRSERPGKDTVHGFRTSFRVWAAEKTKFPREIAEAALAHAVANKVEAAYRRTDYLDERTKLMERWSNFVTKALPVA